MSDAQLIRVVIPGVPRAWERAGHRIARSGTGKQFITSYTPNQTRAEQGAVKLFATRAMNGRPPLDGPIDLRMCAFMPIPRSWSQRKQAAALAGTIYPTAKPDFDNLIKSWADAVKAIIWRDDSQVVAATVWKRFSAEPRVVVEVRLMETPLEALTKRRPSDSTAGPEGESYSGGNT